MLLEFGTEEQKLRHLPAILKGEELWMQFLSEPSGGSDVAGALTTAVRDGDEWILNGSKVWTTGAWLSDWGLCLARTNWDVPKHRGLSVFIFPLHQPGIEIHRIEMLNGFKDFCQEFITDVRVPDTDRIGDVDEGWTVGTRWMFHERMLHNSPYVTSATGNAGSARRSLHDVDIARDSGRIDDPISRDLLGEAYMLELVGEALQHRIAEGISTGTMSDQAASVGRLFGGVVDDARLTSIAFELAGCSRRRLGRRRRRRRRDRQRLPAAPGVDASAAARPRWPATSSASACSACPASCRTTATPRSATSPKARRPSSRTRVAMSDTDHPPVRSLIAGMIQREMMLTPAVPGAP